MFNFLITLGGISLGMSAVILLMLLLNGSAKKRFTAGCRYILWSIVIIRLCIPFSLNIIPNLITLPEEKINISVSDKAAITENKETVTDNIKTEIPPAVNEVSNTPVYRADDNTVTDASQNSEKSFRITKEDIVTAVFAVWGLGAIGFILVTFVNYIANTHTLNRSLRGAGACIENVYTDLCIEEGIKRIPPLYISDIASSPMVYGFIKPRIILPDMEFEVKNLECILRHELVHYRRRDLFVKLLSMLANAIHWFNPLVYMACVQLSSEMELSCDEVALELKSEAERIDYGSSMLEIVKRCKGVPKLTTGFNPKRKAVKERFENIVERRHRHKGYLLVIVALIAAFLAGGIIGFGAAPNKAEDKPVENTVDSSDPQEPEYPSERIEYTVNFDGWSLYYEYDGLVLEKEDGRWFKYSKNSGGDYYIDFTPYSENKAYGYIIGDYALIRYDMTRYNAEDEVKQGIVAVELQGGKIQCRREFTSDDFISAHSLPADVFAGYKATEGYAPSYKIYFAAVEYNAGDIQPIYSFLETNDGWCKISLALEFDKRSGQFTEEVPSMGVDAYEVNAVNNIADIGSMEGLDPIAMECVTAFLSKDIKKLTELGGYYDSKLLDYETLKFGEYTVSRRGGDKLRLDVEVLLSGVDGIEKGKHTFIYQNFAASYMEHYCGHYSHIQPNKAVELVDEWSMMNSNPVMPYMDADIGQRFEVFEYLMYKHPDLTAKEYSDKAKKIFGIDLAPDAYFAEGVEAEIVIDEGYWQENGVIYNDAYFGRGGNILYYDLIETTFENGIYTATLQYYADYGKTLKAYKVKYYVKEIDGELGLAAPCEKTDETGRNAVYIIV